MDQSIQLSRCKFLLPPFPLLLAVQHGWELLAMLIGSRDVVMSYYKQEPAVKFHLWKLWLGSLQKSSLTDFPNGNILSYPSHSSL